MKGKFCGSLIAACSCVKLMESSAHTGDRSASAGSHQSVGTEAGGEAMTSCQTSCMRGTGGEQPSGDTLAYISLAVSFLTTSISIQPLSVSSCRGYI